MKIGLFYDYFKNKISYEKGICPITERMYEKEVITISWCRSPATKADMDDIVNAILKVMNNIDELR